MISREIVKDVVVVLIHPLPNCALAFPVPPAVKTVDSKVLKVIRPVRLLGLGSGVDNVLLI